MKKINGHLSHSEKNDLIRRIQMIFQDPAASLNANCGKRESKLRVYG